MDRSSWTVCAIHTSVSPPRPSREVGTKSGGRTWPCWLVVTRERRRFVMCWGRVLGPISTMNKRRSYFFPSLNRSDSDEMKEREEERDEKRRRKGGTRRGTRRGTGRGTRRGTRGGRGRVRLTVRNFCIASLLLPTSSIIIFVIELLYYHHTIHQL